MNKLQAKSLPVNLTGVYFLLDNEEVVYIGQSVNIFSRILDHQRGNKKFTDFKYIECEKEELNRLEYMYYQKYNPTKYNKQPVCDPEEKNLTERFELKLKPSQMEALEFLSNEINKSKAKILRKSFDLLLHELNYKEEIKNNQ